MISQDGPGQTPIDAAEAAELIPPLETQFQLNAWEQENIIHGREWAFSKRVLKRLDLLSESSLLELHKKMFGETWKWAGYFRKTEKNICVPFYRMPVDLRNLLDDARYWRQNDTFEPDEFAVRFHFRLVQIHLFPNGNGRHARLVADLLAEQLGRPIFSWGSADLTQGGDARQRYLEALSSADRGDYGPLLEFSRS
jgi:Fic-DOC domain mobile mystery protein B